MLLEEIKLQTNHISAISDFYSVVLGLHVTQPDTGSVTITAGQTTLNFISAVDGTSPFYHFAFNIPSNKIEEAAGWLKSRVELLWIEEYGSFIANFVTWHARSVYFIDPAGNILEFISRSDLNDHVDEAFSPVHIRNISEIGIVFPVEAFDEKVNELLREFPLEYFSKQPPMKHFRALGDDEGLLIVVPQHRNWYPSNIPCGIFPLSLKFIRDEKEYRFHL